MDGFSENYIIKESFIVYLSQMCINERGIFMTYNKKRALSYGGILISVFLAYFCRLGRPENVFMRNLADQCRNCIYLGMYCAWVIYLEKHVVHRKTRRCLTAIGCLMVFWFFVRTVKFHIFHDPLGEHICWYLYYIPMILIPVLGLAAAMFLGEKDGEKTVRKIIALLAFAVVLIISVFTNDLHQLVFRFSGRPPLSDRDYSYGILFIVIQGWIIFCLIWMEIMLIRKSRIPGRKQFWLPVIPGILLLGWNIGNLLRLPLIKTIAGDMTAVEEGDSGYEKLREIFLEIHDCHTEKKPYFYVKLKMLFFDFFYEMLTKHYIIPVSTEQNKSLAAVKEVLDHISLHYQENLTVSELSGLSNYSEYYFMKLFRQYTGKTLVEYINDFRMEKAKYLLTHSDAPVTEIAMQVGFNSTSYFIKKFQQSNKVSPHKYRKSMRQI